MMRKIFYGWWIVLACSLNSFYVAGIIFYSFTAFFTPIRNEFDWSHTQISFAASLRGLEMGLFAPIVGILVDRMGSRKLILWGTIIAGFGLMLLSRTQSLAMFYGAFLLIALGAGGCSAVATMSAVANWFDKKVSIALGVMASGVGAGGLMVPLTVHLIEVYGWRTTLMILGFGMWGLGIPLSMVIRDKPEKYGCLPDGRVSSEPVHGTKKKEEGKEISLKEAVRSRAFICLNMVEAIRMLVVSAVVVHVMPYLTGLGFSRSRAGLVAAAIPLFSILGRSGFGWLGDIFSKKYIMAWAFTALSLGILAFQYVELLWALILFLLLFPPGYGGGMVLRGASLREYFGRNAFGKIMGVTMGTSAVGGIIGPTLAGWVFDTWGSYDVLWLVFFGIGLLGVGLVFRIK
ncbi:MAG: MFS transporter [Pseudomonadota bacterium]